jgi:hypothetical protein
MPTWEDVVDSNQTPDRITWLQDVTAMVAPDTIELLAKRVTTMLDHGRRITVARRYPHTGQPPEITAGLIQVEPPRLFNRPGDYISLTVPLHPGSSSGFRFATDPADGATEKDVWTAFHTGGDHRRSMTQVRVVGGLAGNSPAANDKIVINFWNQDGVCRETVIVFDHATGRHNTLTAVRDELRVHLANLRDKQPWENRAMLERAWAALEAHAAIDGGDQ